MKWKANTVIFVTVICSHIYPPTVGSWHLSARLVVPVTWIYVLTWQILTISIWHVPFLHLIPGTDTLAMSISLQSWRWPRDNLPQACPPAFPTSCNYVNIITFVIAICLHIYAAMVCSQHLSAHSVILATWVYTLTVREPCSLYGDFTIFHNSLFFFL